MSETCEDGKQYDVLVVFTFGDKVRKARPLCRLLNAVLPVSSILIFILGVTFLFWQNSGRIPMDDYSILLYYALVLASLFVHEAAHLISAVAFGYFIIIIANLIPAKGLEVDGEVALNYLFEVKRIYPAAKKCVRSKKRRRKLIRSAGLAGIACIALFRLILFTNEKYILWDGLILVSPIIFMALYCAG